MLIYQKKHNPTDPANGIYFLPLTSIKVDLSQTDSMHPQEVPDDWAKQLLRDSNIRRTTVDTIENAELKLKEREAKLEKDKAELKAFKEARAKKAEEEKLLAEAEAKKLDEADDYEVPEVVDLKPDYSSMERSQLWKIMKKEGFTGKWSETSKEEMVVWLNAL